MSDQPNKELVKMNVMWFRRGLRLHDNPALLSCIRACVEEESVKTDEKRQFMACYIFDEPAEGDFLKKC